MKANDNIVGEPEDIVRKYLNLVWKVVHRYKGWLNKVHGVEMDDLYSVGCIGLIRGYEFYKPEKGDITQYFFTRIRMEINRFINNYNDTLSFPRRAREIHSQLYKKELLNNTPKEIMEQTDFKLSDILVALEYSKCYTVSTSISISGEDGNGTEIMTIEDMLISFNDLESNIIIKEIFDLMDDREKKILYLYYYKQMNTSQIGKIIQLSQPNVSRAMKKIKSKLVIYSTAI